MAVYSADAQLVPLSSVLNESGTVSGTVAVAVAEPASGSVVHSTPSKSPAMTPLPAAASALLDADIATNSIAGKSAALAASSPIASSSLNDAASTAPAPATAPSPETPLSAHSQLSDSKPAGMHLVTSHLFSLIRLASLSRIYFTFATPFPQSLSLLSNVLLVMKCVSNNYRIFICISPSYININIYDLIDIRVLTSHSFLIYDFRTEMQYIIVNSDIP